MALIEFKDISIQFPGVLALDQVSFKIQEGEAVALCGENGAGKSTLGKILSGVYSHKQYTGDVYYKGKELKNNLTVDAERKGIYIVHQELTLLGELTVAENIFLSHFPQKVGLLKKQEIQRQAKQFLEEVGLELSPDMKVKDLSIAMQQMVEIARALSGHAEVILFDESTSALTSKEIEGFFEIVRKLKKRGVTTIFITHKLDEIFQICDSVTVLKDGRLVRSECCLKAVTKDDIIRMMIGRELKDMYPPKANNITSNKPIFEVKNWTLVDSQNKEKVIVDDFSFSINQNEILGFYGLVGAGRTELIESVFGGSSSVSSGQIYLNGERIRIRSSKDAVKYGISLVTENRKDSGLFLEHSVNDNLSVASLNRLTGRLPFINVDLEAKKNDEMIQKMEVKVSSKWQSVDSLSGGNQQKVLLGKWLLTQPKVLILDEPTKGIDVGTKAEIYKKLRALSNAGIGVLVCSSELPEIIGVCDRVVIVRDGKNAGEVGMDAMTEQALFDIAIGRNCFECTSET